MAELKDYKNSDFSLTVNNRMHGIELRFAQKMSEEQLANVKEAGFRWSKRQQMWYAYQNEKSIAYAESLVNYYKNTMSAQEFNQKVEEELSKIEQDNINKSEPEIIPLEPLKILSVEQVENPIEEITVNELAELIRQRAELDRRIAEIKEVINSDGKKVDVSSEQAREFVLDMNGAQNVSESTFDNENQINKNQIEEKSSENNKPIELSIDDLETAKKFIPEMEYSTLLNNATHGEEAEYFKQKIKHVADMGHILYENRDGKSYNAETKLHDKGFIHYYIGSSDWYVSEVDEDNMSFGFAIVNGDTQNAEYGYIDLNEVTTLTLNGFTQTELDIYNDDGISMEHAIVEKYPELRNELLEESVDLADSFKSENIGTDNKKLAEYIIKHPLSSLDISADVVKQLDEVAKQINNYVEHGTLPKNQRFSLPNSPTYLKALGADDTEISLPVSVVKKAIEKHNLSAGEINRAIMRLYDPMFAFEKEEGENQKPSLLMITDEFHYVNENDNNPLVLSLNINDEIRIKHHTVEVQDVRTIFDKTLTAQDGTNLIDYWTRQGYCRYVDDKKITDWNTVSRNLFPIEVFQSAYNNILTKSSLVNEKQSKEIIHTEQLTSKKEIKSIREQCREILQKPDSEITEEDKAILARYEGAGGLNEENRTSAGVLNEFYTPNNLVEKVWQIVDAYAPDAKTVLEPSAGVGKFANNRPYNVFTMHELDETSARINKILHPDAKVIQGAFQKQFFDDDERFIKIGYEQSHYDVVIGNPPYGTYNNKYKGLGEGREFDRYEEYFIARGLDALKDEKSVMAFVVPSGFLNTATDKQKEIIGSKGILIDAYRLPVGAFPTTDVGTDIIVMKPWIWNESESVSKEEMAKVYADEISNNDWFKKHPEKILGEVKQKTNRFGKVEDVVVVHEGLTVQDELSKIDSLLPKIQVHIEKDNNKTRQSLESSEKSNNNILRTPKTYPYINDDGSLNPDRLNEGDIIIDKDDGIPYKAHMIFGNQYVRVTSVSMKKENSSLFEELEEKSKSDEHSFELGAGWKDVLNDRFSAPAKEQLENWKYPSWYQKHLDEQEEYESQRDYIRQPVLKILEESKDGKTYNKDELTHIYAETLAKELDFICHHNDIAFEERINPATGEKMKFSTDEYEYARIKHVIPEICDFYGTDLVKSIIYNTAIHFIDETKEDTYLRLQKQYPDFFSEKTANLSILKSIKDISCTEEYVGTKEHGNSIWDLTREYINNVKDKSIDENHNLENVFKHNNLSLSSDAIKITETAKFLNTELPVIKNKKQKKNSSLKNSSVEKSPVMSAEEFSRLYGKDFDEKEFPIWRATDWEGIIDRTKLNFEEENLLHTSQNYVEIEPGQFTHKVLFESGDITAKIESYKNKISFLNQNEDENKIALYQKNIQQLESVSLPKIPIDRIHFGVNSTLAEEFKIDHINSDGEIERLNLQESFILWAKGMTWEEASGSGCYWRGGIDYATANISEEDLPQNVTWYDIVEYIDRKSVKADRVSTWRKSDEEINADKAQKRKEAEEKRMARSETADRLFDKYLHEGLSPELSAKVEAEYNRRFNSYLIPDYSKLPLFIDGMSREKDGKKFKLYDQQIKGVSFLCNKGNGLLAYDVGVGKTAAGIVATVNQIQTGRCKRPVIVVPNAVYAKWYKDIQDLFPNIKVNDLYNLNKESSSKYRNAENPHKLDIPENSISLVTYEALKNITFTDESCENELLDDYSKLLSEDFDGSDRENAGAKEKIKGVIGVASQVKNTNYVFFEDCGFDNITVDEAHNFKNLWTVPRPKNKGESNEFSGIPTGKPSARALKLFAMTQLTQRHNDDRNVFLLTATPFTNSPLEVYSMLSYVGRKRLIESGIYSLRDFCTEFAHTKLELGVNAKGEIDQKQVMKDWKELPALQKILTEFIDKVDGEELKEIIRPKKFTYVQEIEMSDLQKKMMQIDTEKMTEVKEGNSAAVIVSMNAMRVGLVAPALADPTRYPGLELPSMEKLVETSPKLKFVCDSVIDMYKNNPEKGQFIYMPLGQTAHGIVKDYLVANGLPKEAVEIINGSVNNTTDKKAKVTEKFNDPKNKCKILIGGKNTSEGIDLNGNSFVMYNCSLGWNPSETIQAEGRIWRQGNQQGHVHCVYPVMNDSIDSLLYQKHDEKRSRINEIWTYKAGDTLNVEDINPEELKFELIKDPQKRAKLILENGIDTPEYKFTGTKHIQNELNKVNSRIKSFEETDEKRKNLVENLKGAEIKIQNRLKNIEDYKSRELEVPEWCKMELKEERKYKESYEHQLETINRKFSSWGIKDDKDIEEFIPKMNAQKHSLEKELEEKKKELPKILAKENLKMQEKKILLPPVSEQRKQLTEDIQKNLRPMAEVEPEIRTQRFEQMLEQKWKKGEITTDERDFYSSVGYKCYYEWLDGEIENFDIPFENKDAEITLNQEVNVQIENEQNQSETTVEKETFDNGGLFSDQVLAELDQINKDLMPKVHQLITYTEDSGIDEKLEYPTLSEAQKEGKQFLKEWELGESENGFVVFNRETKQIESSYGYFPVEEAFSKDVLLANGYKTLVAKGPFVESSVSEISNAIKERLARQNISANHIDSHISFTGVKPNVNKNTVNGYCD